MVRSTISAQVDDKSTGKKAAMTSESSIFLLLQFGRIRGRKRKTNKNFEIKSTHINSHYDLHFHPFYFNSPSSSGFIKNSLKSFAYVNLISLPLLILHSYACNITVFWIEWCIHHLYTCMDPEMLSRSLRISWSILVPKMFLSVVWARRRVEWCAFSTFATETVAFDTR